MTNDIEHPRRFRIATGPACVFGRVTNPLQQAVPLVMLGLFAVGCSSPSGANIALRKQVQNQADEITRLKRQHAADVADDKGDSHSPATTRPISDAFAELLYTTHGVRIGSLTGWTADGLTVHVYPIDDDGESFKAAGSLIVEVYDLNDTGHRVADWQFDQAKTRSLWNGTLLRQEFVVPCPWPRPTKPTTAPATDHGLMLKVTFIDTLTRRPFEVLHELPARPAVTTPE